MNFTIDEDSGGLITGWFLPDNPSQEPSFLVQADRQSCVIAPTRVHSNMIDMGLHDTGNVGFEVSERHLPGLAGAVDVRITERESGLLFYVRPKARPYVHGRLFAFDMREGPDSLCSQAFADAYAMAFPDVHRQGQDTRKACYQAKFVSSLYAGGAPCIRADDPFLMESDFQRVALLPDPLRLIFDLLMPDADPGDPACVPHLSKRIARLGRDDRQLLSEPLTRRLCLLFVDDTLPKDAAAQALETLSGFDAVGVEDDIAGFVELTAAICNAAPGSFTVPQQRAPLPLSRQLRRDSQVRALVGRDLDIYDAVLDALAETNGRRA
jgi:hypothetical protein